MQDAQPGQWELHMPHSACSSQNPMQADCCMDATSQPHLHFRLNARGSSDSTHQRHDHGQVSQRVAAPPGDSVLHLWLLASGDMGTHTLTRMGSTLTMENVNVPQMGQARAQCWSGNTEMRRRVRYKLRRAAYVPSAQAVQQNRCRSNSCMREGHASDIPEIPFFGISAWTTGPFKICLFWSSQSFLLTSLAGRGQGQNECAPLRLQQLTHHISTTKTRRCAHLKNLSDLLLKLRCPCVSVLPSIHC